MEKFLQMKVNQMKLNILKKFIKLLEIKINNFIELLEIKIINFIKLLGIKIINFIELLGIIIGRTILIGILLIFPVIIPIMIFLEIRDFFINLWSIR